MNASDGLEDGPSDLAQPKHTVMCPTRLKALLMFDWASAWLHTHTLTLHLAGRLYNLTPVSSGYGCGGRLTENGRNNSWTKSQSAVCNSGAHTHTHTHTATRAKPESGRDDRCSYPCSVHSVTVRLCKSLQSSLYCGV